MPADAAECDVTLLLELLRISLRRPLILRLRNARLVDVEQCVGGAPGSAIEHRAANFHQCDAEAIKPRHGLASEKPLAGAGK